VEVDGEGNIKNEISKSLLDTNGEADESKESNESKEKQFDV
jgi:hypothetical protein